MAQTQGTDTGGFGAGFKDFLFGVADKAIQYEQAKRVDVETTSSGRNVPDNADMVAGQTRQAASDTLGGSFKKAIAGVSIQNWLLIGGGIAVGSVVLKKLRVI